MTYFFRYPAFWVVTATLAGFFLQSYFSLSLSWLIFSLLLFLLFAVSLFYRSRMFFWSIMVVWLVIGATVHNLSFDLPQERILEKEGETITIEGNLIEKDRRYFITRVSNFSAYSPSLLLRGGDFNSEEWGYRVRIRGKLHSFNSCSNPGVVDFRQFWGRKRIPAYLEVKDWEIISPPQGWFSLMHRVEEKKREFLSSWRKELGNEYPWFSAILLGEKEKEFEEKRDLLQEVGIYHAFCVSGLNLALLGGIIWFLLNRIAFIKRFSWIGAVVFTFWYLLFCSLSPSSFRAWLFFSLALWGKTKGRYVLSSSFLVVAFLTMFLLQPEVVYDAGAQLSFASTAGILFLMDYGEKFPSKKYFLLDYLGRGVFLTFNVCIFNLPFLIFWGFSFSSLSLLGNLLVLPLLEIALFLSFGSAFLGGIAFLRPLFAALLKVTLRASLLVSAFLEEHTPYFFWDFSQVSNQLWGWILWASLLGLFIFLFGKEKKKWIWGSVLGGALLVGGLYLFLPPPLEFWVFDVGQGLATGIVEGKTINFVDSGGIIRGYGNIGEAILKKFIHYRDIERVNHIFLTHHHRDHTGGVEPLSSSFPNVSVLVLSYFPNFSRVPLSSSTEIEIFPLQGDKENDQALVFRLTLSQLRILICGDIEEEGINQLMGWGKERLKSQVVILPHHGKYVSNIAELLSLCDCEVAVISCGENSYGHPHPETIKLLTDLKMPYFITQKDGAICFRPTRKNWEVKKFGKGRI